MSTEALPLLRRIAAARGANTGRTNPASLDSRSESENTAPELAMLNAVEAESRRYWQGYTLVLLWFLRIESPRMSCETSRSVDQRQRVTLARRSLDGTRSLQLAQTRHSRNLLAD